MGTGNHIDIVRSHFLQAQHHLGKFCDAEFNAQGSRTLLTSVGDLMILTVGTVQGTAAEEDHPRSMFAGYRRLLPLVQA